MSKKLNNCTVFISWSGETSRRFALTIREMLKNVYHIPEGEIFFSDQNLFGRDWVTSIKKYAQSCVVGISCLTKENYDSKWMLFEAGAMNANATVIPVLIDFPMKDLPDDYEIYRTNICIACNPDNMDQCLENSDYQLFLRKLFTAIENVDAIRLRFLEKCGDYQARRNKSMKKYSAHLLEMVTKYRLSYKYFISRPIKGYQKSDELTDILAQISKESGDIFFSTDTNVNQEDSKYLLSERIENIRNSRCFLFIYPKIDIGMPPSSCLLELGAAYAFRKKIIIIYQKDADLPFFITNLSSDLIERKPYTDNDELYQVVQSQIESMSKQSR